MPHFATKRAPVFIIVDRYRNWRYHVSRCVILRGRGVALLCGRKLERPPPAFDYDSRRWSAQQKPTAQNDQKKWLHIFFFKGRNISFQHTCKP